MKQGRATHSGSGSTKIEPISHAISPAAVSQIGIMKGNHASDGGHTVHVKPTPMMEGRGLKAPMTGVTVHKSGSQRG